MQLGLEQGEGTARSPGAEAKLPLPQGRLLQLWPAVGGSLTLPSPTWISTQHGLSRSNPGTLHICDLHTFLCPWPPGGACTWDWRPLACCLGSSSAGKLLWPRCPAALPLLDLECFCLEFSKKLWHHTKKDIDWKSENLDVSFIIRSLGLRVVFGT